MIVGFLLVSSPVYAGSVPAGPFTFGDAVVSSTEQSPKEVEEYWTPERMRDAKPMPMPSIDGPPIVHSPLPRPTMPSIDGDPVEVPFGDCSEGKCPMAGNGEPGVADGAAGGAAEGSAGAPGEWLP